MLEASEKDLLELAGEELAKVILKMRKGDVSIRPGYDGVYGEISVNFSDIQPKQQNLL